MAKYKQEVLEKIKSDPDLFSVVLKAMKIKPGSLLQALIRESNTITEYDIVVLVASHLGVEPDDVVENDCKETVNVIQGNH